MNNQNKYVLGLLASFIIGFSCCGFLMILTPSKASEAEPDLVETQWYYVRVGKDVYHIEDPEVKYMFEAFDYATTRVYEKGILVAEYPEKLPWHIEKAEKEMRAPN